MICVNQPAGSSQGRSKGPVRSDLLRPALRSGAPAGPFLLVVLTGTPAARPIVLGSPGGAGHPVPGAAKRMCLAADRGSPLSERLAEECGHAGCVGFGVAI